VILALSVSACYNQPISYLEGPAVAAGNDQAVAAGASEPSIIAPPTPPATDAAPYQCMLCGTPSSAM
jgi:hypothetical protein